ncbi:hypothetical protein EP7_004774 [Isosphaeraceae bacterium EP7]
MNSPSIIVPLRKDRTINAAAVLALSSVDLTPGDESNDVFGQASQLQRVGVRSIHQFSDPKIEPEVVLRRTLQAAIHEAGHMPGIRHATLNECGMNESDQVDELD